MAYEDQSVLVLGHGHHVNHEPPRQDDNGQHKSTSRLPRATGKISSTAWHQNRGKSLHAVVEGPDNESHQRHIGTYIGNVNQLKLSYSPEENWAFWRRAHMLL